MQIDDARSVGALAPSLILSGDRRRALELVSRFDRDEPSWLAEAFMLLNTTTLRQDDWRYMGSTIFRNGSWSKEIRLATYVAARLGSIGFSFPKWRFLTQSFSGGSSMLERFGMHRIDARRTDRTVDGCADLFGPGFVAHVGSSYLELRRAYVAISDRFGRFPATIVVRNSSFHFGRDRLEHPAYVCWEPLSSSEIEALAPEDFSAPGRFSPWHLSFPRQAAEPCEGIFAVAELLQKLSRLERDLERWMRRDGPPLRRDYRTSPDGRLHLLKLLEGSATTRGRPLVGEIPADSPPWSPIRAADPLLGDVTSFLHPVDGNATRLVLLSGLSGDLPLASATAGGQISAK